MLKTAISIQARQDLSRAELIVFFSQAIGSEGNGMLSDALDLVVDPHDARMTVEEVTVTDVCIAADGSVEIYYEVGASAYYGCSDQDNYDTHESSVSGKLLDGQWVFQRFVYPEPLSPNEEF